MTEKIATSIPRGMYLGESCVYPSVSSGIALTILLNLIIKLQFYFLSGTLLAL